MSKDLVFGSSSWFFCVRVATPTSEQLGRLTALFSCLSWSNKKY